MFSVMISASDTLGKTSRWEGNRLVKAGFGNHDSEYKALGISTLHPGSAAG